MKSLWNMKPSRLARRPSTRPERQVCIKTPRAKAQVVEATFKVAKVERKVEKAAVKETAAEPKVEKAKRFVFSFATPARAAEETAANL